MHLHYLGLFLFCTADQVTWYTYLPIPASFLQMMLLQAEAGELSITLLFLKGLFLTDTVFSARGVTSCCSQPL